MGGMSAIGLRRSTGVNARPASLPSEELNLQKNPRVSPVAIREKIEKGGNPVLLSKAQVGWGCFSLVMLLCKDFSMSYNTVWRYT